MSLPCSPSSSLFISHSSSSSPSSSSWEFNAIGLFLSLDVLLSNSKLKRQLTVIWAWQKCEFIKLFSCLEDVFSCSRPPIPVRLSSGVSFQPPEHLGVDPRQHEEQPHQHDPHRHRHRRLPEPAGVHPIQRPHVPPRPWRQGPEGNGEAWDKSVYWIYWIMNNWCPQIHLFVCSIRRAGATSCSFMWTSATSSTRSPSSWHFLSPSGGSSWLSSQLRVSSSVLWRSVKLSWV